MLMVGLLLSSSAHAQGVVVEGRTQPVAPGRDSTGQDVDYLINAELGRQLPGGRNLVHSFREFSLATGEIASFEGPNSVANLIALVRGGSRSSIDGTVRSNILGSTLFFLNPSGILFGPNASLNLPGSFFASTATQLRLDDGSIFDVREGTVAPLLSTAAPDEFGFLNPAAPIELDGSALAVPTTRVSDPDGGLDPGAGPGTLGLIASGLKIHGKGPFGSGAFFRGDRVVLDGSSIELDGGIEGGKEIELRGGDLLLLGAAFDAPSVSITGRSITADGGDIGFNDFDETTRETVRLAADSIRLKGTSFRNQNGGSVSVNATRDLTLEGAFIEADELSIRGGNVELFGARLYAPQLLIDGQRLLIDAQRITFDDGATIETPTSIGVFEFREFGFSADLKPTITLNATDEIIIRNGGVDAPVRVLSGVAPPLDSRLSVSVATSRLVVENAGYISVGVEGLFTDNDGVPLPVPAGGVVEIKAGEVTVQSGGRIDTSTQGVSTGGVIDIAAERFIDVADAGSRILAFTNGDGEGGTIRLKAPQVRIRDGARVSAETGFVAPLPDPAPLPGDPPIGGDPFPGSEPPEPPRLGKAGVVSIEAGTLSVEKGGQISSETSGAGDGGTVKLLAKDSIRVTDGSLVTAKSTGPGNAGSVELRSTAGSISVERDSEISSTTSGSGNGGAILLDAASSILISDRSRVTAASTGSGMPGTVEVRTRGALVLEGGSVITTSGESGLGGDVKVKAKTIKIDDSDIGTDVGSGNSGNIDLEAEAIALLEGSSLVTRSGEGRGGRITIRTSAFLRAPGTVIDASAGVGIDGVIDIGPQAVDLNASLARLASTYEDPSSLLVERCQLRDQETQGSFTVAGREGTPETTRRRPAARYSRVATPPDAAERGDFDAFLRSAPLTDAASAPVGRLLRSAEVLEALGELSGARDLLALALERAGRPEAARILALRARLWARAGVYGNAERDFAGAERAAEELGDAGLLARVLLDRANAHAERGELERARDVYARAFASAERAEDAEVSAQLAAATAQGREPLLAAVERLAALPTTHDRLFATVHVGLGLAALPDDAARLRAGEVFTRVVEQAQDLGDRAAESYAWGHLAELYAREGRGAESTELARRALVAAAAADRHEAVYRWSGTLGDGLRAAGDLEAAARTYELGVQAVENLRDETVLSARAHAEVAAAFPGRPLSMSLVDVLLAQASQSRDAASRARLLEAARDRIEASSRREIRDYFQDECLALERASRADTRDDALAVYPVLLEDRAELIVSDGRRGMAQVRVDASAAELHEAIAALRALLEDRSTHEYRKPAAKLYDWLIRPLEPFLAQGGAERTLVMIPSGPFASLPFAALYDARQRQFLVEQRPVAMSPGLSLMEARPLHAGPHTALQAALTQSVDEFPALAAAGSEVERIQHLLGGKTLLDAEFNGPALDRELGTTPYEIVHIASHGEFGGDPDSAFLLTFNGRLGMSDLADLVGRTRFRDRPLELLTLSACQTAAGDERAALGLAGVAVRAGARSTLASLWSVNDPATARLMERFYGELVQEGASRARALQRAQQTLLRDPIYRHPAYWAPFVLVGSWR